MNQFPVNRRKGPRRFFGRVVRRSSGISRDAVNAGYSAVSAIDNIVSSAYNSMRGERPDAPIVGFARASLVASQLMVYVSSLALGGLIAYKTITTPVPEPVAPPKIAAVQQAPDIKSLEQKIAGQKRNFMIRVLFGESAAYDPENNSTNLADYKSSFLQHLINTLNVIDNRRSDEKNFSRQDDMVKVSIVPGQFGSVAKYRNLFFSRPMPEDFLNLSVDELLGYLNTSPISESELLSKWTGGRDISPAREKLRMVTDAYDTFLDKQKLNALINSGKLELLMPKKVTFYNSSSSMDNQCIGTALVYSFRADPKAMNSGRRTYHGVEGTCSFSPNKEGRMEKYYGVVIHSTRGKLPPGQEVAAAVSWFMNPLSKASAHLVIGLNQGQIYKMVDEEYQAQHAGFLNFAYLGIELEQGKITDEYSDFQYFSSARAIRAWSKSKGFPVIRSGKTLTVLGHDETSQGEKEKKSDPGPKFNWSRLLSYVRQMN